MKADARTIAREPFDSGAVLLPRLRANASLRGYPSLSAPVGTGAATSDEAKRPSAISSRWWIRLGRGHPSSVGKASRGGGAWSEGGTAPGTGSPLFSDAGGTAPGSRRDLPVSGADRAPAVVL